MPVNRCTPMLDAARFAAADSWIDRVEDLLWSIEGVGPEASRGSDTVLSSPGTLPSDLPRRIVDAAMSRWGDVASLGCRCDASGGGAVDGELLLELSGGGVLVACFQVGGTAPPTVREVWVDE